MTLHYDIQLQPRGRLVRMEWNPTIGRSFECQIPPDEFAYHLHGTICFAHGVTLRDLIALIADNLEMFSALTACDCLGEIVAEAENERPEDLAGLELAWSAESVQTPTATVLDSSVEFYGLGANGERIGLEFTPSGRLAGLPLLLNESFNVQEGASGTILSTTRRFTLLEVITSVIGELTFLGSPDERNEALSDLNRRIQSADEGEFYTIEEVKAEWERRAEEERRKFPCRICGEDSRCACFGKPADLCHKCFGAMKEN